MKILKIFFIILFQILILSCSDNTAGTVDDTDTQIAFNGYVKDEQNIGIKGIIAKIVGTSFLDTTDETGQYSILVSLDTLSKYGIIIDSLSEIEFINDDEILDTLEVENYKIDLPTITFNRIIILGKFLTEQSDYKQIEAIISGNSKDLNYFDTVSLSVDSIFSGYCSYSGSIFFNNGFTDTLYSVYIKVFNVDSLFVGQSPEVIFSHKSNSVMIPNFNPFNAMPSVSLSSDRDSVSINDQVILTISAKDIYGEISKLELNTGPSGEFEIYSDTICTTAVSSIPGIQKFIARATDDDSLVSLDTCFINILLDPPVIDSFVVYQSSEQDNPLVGRAVYHDNFGKVSSCSWSYLFKISFSELTMGKENDSTYYSDFLVFPGSILTDSFGMVLKIIDDDGNILFDTTNVILNDTLIGNLRSDTLLK